MNGRKLGTLSLRLDAVYCLLLGAAIGVASPTIATAVPIPAMIIALIGGVIVLWAGAVVWMAASLPLRIALRVVMAANLLAATAIAAFSITAVGIVTLVSVLAIAVDIAAFAASQAVALTRLRTAPTV